MCLCSQIVLVCVVQVVSGLMQADESVIVNTDNCAQLFGHEAMRIFHDRLVDQEDKTAFFSLLADNLHDHFKVSAATGVVWRWDVWLSLRHAHPSTNSAVLCFAKCTCGHHILDMNQRKANLAFSCK